MSAVDSPRPRIVVDGKFFRLGGQKFVVKGVAYGPFPPNAQGLPFPGPEQAAADLDQIRELGANTLRLYHVPPRWFLDLALERRLFAFVDIPWNKHLSLDSEPRREAAREAVRQAIAAVGRHPAVFACSLANEIPPDLVRWHGAGAVAGFLDELATFARRIAPDCLLTFSNFPPTEFLQPGNLDFVCFNIYLHYEAPFKNYLARLQMLADSRPLILGEFGIDSIREGERRQKELLSWQIETAFRGGLAGAVVFTYTDEWFKDGRIVEDWKMGLVTRQRAPRPAFHAVGEGFRIAPYFALSRHPKVSVVVASYNAARTLQVCLDSLQRQNYPVCEIILVDDGSTDSTPQIAALNPSVRYFRHLQNLGLSVARNTGITAATGEIVAFTDADCRADEDWLRYLVGDLLDSEFAGMGGPNLLPPEDSAVAAAVMASPGGPAHVMLTDRQAEHIPGCNMAFYKWALEEIGGFDPVFHKAGDDVDVCWRLQQAGYKIGFSPGGFVWHYRRATIQAYLKQQHGYGEAEALLVRKHPENFNSFGGGLWRGRIYAPAKFSVEVHRSIIYHGLFGSAGFQKLYTAGPATMLMLCTTLEYHLFATLPAFILSVPFPYLLPVTVLSLVIPLAICSAAGLQASLPADRTRWWSRPLVALMFLLQPVIRGWARYRGRLTLRPPAPAVQDSLDSIALRKSGHPLDEVSYWTEKRIERLEFVATLLRRLEQAHWPHRTDTGWSEFDLEIYGSRWSQLQLTTVAEDHPGGRQLIRCRLRATWSLLAQLAFGSLLGADLLLIGLLGPGRFWPWLLLGTLPLYDWARRRDQRRLQSIAAVFLDELARGRGLAKIQTE